jgi:hypothetical protein
MDDPTSPYAALSLIVAPAVLTNAASILVLSTSNRLARAVDRARSLAVELDTPAGRPSQFASLRLQELDGAERRALMLLSALRLFYASLGAFAASAITSLFGAVVSQTRSGTLSATLELIAVAAGLIAVAGLILGCVLLLRETRIAVRGLSEEARLMREYFGSTKRT